MLENNAKKRNHSLSARPLNKQGVHFSQTIKFWALEQSWESQRSLEVGQIIMSLPAAYLFSTYIFQVQYYNSMNLAAMSALAFVRLVRLRWISNTSSPASLQAAKFDCHAAESRNAYAEIVHVAGGQRASGITISNNTNTQFAPDKIH